MEVESAGRYANHLHLAPVIRHASTLHSIFHRPDALPAVKPSTEGVKSNNKNINNNNNNYNKWSK